MNGTVTDDGLPATGTLTSLWAQVSGPGTTSFEAPLLSETVATFSAPGTYVLRLSATDSDLTASSEVTITVHPENHAPNVSAGADQTISLPAAAELNGSATGDGWPYGSSLSVAWSAVSGPGTVVFANPVVTVTSASFTEPGTYVLRLTAGDSELTTSDDVVITVTPPNTLPVVTAGTDQTITLPAGANLNGTVTDDGLPLGSSVSASWSKVSGPGDVSFANASQPQTTAQFSVAGDYVLRLTATDGALTAGDDVAITVIPENHAPTVDAGADQTITLPITLSLNGSTSDDGLPAGSTLATTWSKVSGPGIVTFDNPNVTVTIAAFSEAGTYVLRLTANDSELNASDDITVTVIPENHAPTANAGADQTITLPNVATLNGSASDDGLPAGSTLTTTWSKVSGPGTVTFGNAQVSVTTAGFSVAGTYVLRLTASDSELTAADEVQLIVIPQNFAPTVNAGADQTITFPNTVNLNGSVSDDGLPAGSTLSTGWSQVSGPGMVTFANPSVTVTTASFSLAGVYVLRLTASDSLLTSSDDVSINVQDLRVAPNADFVAPQSSGTAGGFVIASSGAASGSTPELMFDNNPSTNWITNGPTNQFVKIQFFDQQNVFIDRVRLQTSTSSSAMKDFEVQVSTTTSADASFVTVLNATCLNNAQLQEFMLPGGPARARFIKFLPKNNHVGTGNIHVSTLNPVAVGSVDPIISLPGQINAALSQSPSRFPNGGVIHSTSYAGGTNSPNGLLTYNGGGWTTSGTANQFAIIQLGGTQLHTLKGVKVATADEFAFGRITGVKDFEVWVSTTTTDNSAFTRVLAATVPFTGGVQTYLFPGGPVQARYLKYVPLNNNGGQPVINTLLFDVIVESGARVMEKSGEFQNSPFPVEAAFDGDPNNIWFGPNNVNTNIWVKTSLTDEAIHKLYGVRIHPVNDFQFRDRGPKDFDIRVSTTTLDDSAFTTVFSGTLANLGVSQEFRFPDLVDAKYVQFFFKNSYSTSITGVRELEVLTAPLRGSALIAFSSQEELAGNCIDLDPVNQVWSTANGQTTNQWIKLLLPRGELSTINHIALRPGIAANSAYGAPKDFELQVSTTDSADSSFTTVLAGTLVNSTQLQDFYFPATQARYVKLLLKNNYQFTRIGLASFYVYATDEIGTTTRFVDQSSDTDGPIVSWAWDFGDGQTSSERHPTHTYAKPGDYTVSLTVTDHSGLTSTHQAAYRVFQSLRTDFSYSPVLPHEAGESVRFTDLSRTMLQPSAQRQYNFGDGSSLSVTSGLPTHTYLDNGILTGTLRIGDPQGLDLSASKTITVLNMPPSVDIDPGKTIVWGEPWTSVPRITEQGPFDRNTLQGQWNFGDGQTSQCVNCTNANATVTHSYSNAGTYDAVLTVTDKDGGVGSDTATFIVNKRPTVFSVQAPASPTNGSPLVMHALLKETFANLPLSGKPIQFTLNGATFNAVTGADGVAEVSVPLPAGTRIDIIIGTFVGDSFYATSSGVGVPVTAGGTPPAATPSNVGTDFWLMFPASVGPNAVQRIFITSTVNTTGTVTFAALNFTQNFTVQANTVVTVQLPIAASEVTQSDVVTSRAVHVTSQQPVVVYGLNQRAFSSDAYLGLPVSALGKDYYVLTYGNMSFAPSSEFGVVASENGTSVTITPSATTGTRLAGVPYNLVLNQGQTYLLQNTVPTTAGDLSGSRVTSDKPVAVFGAHMAATIPAEGICCADHLVEQLPPTTAWGKRFATVPLATRNKGDFFRLIAAEDGTTIYLNGSATVTLDHGQWVKRILKTPTEIIATKPIMVAQYATSGIGYDPATTGKADPFIMIIPPYSQYLNHYTISTPLGGFEINYVNVVAPTAQIGSITLDGAPIPAVGFTPIGMSGYSGAQIPITVGTHNLDGPGSFGVFVYGFNTDESYGYPGGMNMSTPVEATNVSVAPETSGHAINRQACLVATATDENQNPLGGRSVSFNVTGANPSNSSAQTDAAGQATLCYVGTSTGTDQVSATLGAGQGTATVIWTPTNAAPVVNAGADQTVTLPAPANLTGSATDDGLPANILNVSWSKVSGPGNVVFGNAGAATTTASFDAQGTYVLRLTASDTDFTISDDVQVIVNPVPTNQAPTANAGPDLSVAINGNLIVNGGNEEQLVSGEIAGWTEVQGTNWTQGTANTSSGFPEAQRGTAYFFASDAPQAELRQDVDVSAFATNIAAGTQQFEFKAYLRSAVEATPDSARVVVEYRNAANTGVIATLDSGEITSTPSTNAWHLTEDTRTVPLGTGWIRVRLIATRNSGTSNDAFFDSVTLRPVGNAAVKLNGTTTDDGLPFGSTLTSTWTTVSGPGVVEFANTNAPVSGASFLTAGTYVLRLTASDGQLSTSDDVTVVVNPANQAPLVNAGANQTSTLPAAATLNGSVSDDGQPPGSSVSTNWSKLSGPGVVTFANANAAATSVSFSTAGTYVLRLTADDTEYSASGDVTIAVNPEPVPVNQPPVVNPGPNQTIELPTDTVTLNGTATDDGLPAGSTLTVTWTKVSGPGTVIFGTPNSAVTTAQFSAVGSYVLRLSAGDGEYLISADMGVTLAPQNQPPTANAGPDQTILLSQPAQLNGSASDDGLPAGSNLTTTWTKVSGPGNVTFTNPNVTVTGATFSAVGTYVVRLTATDGALSSSDDLTITVNDNVAPPTVEITSPLDGDELTEPTPVTGSVSNGTRVLEYSLNSEDGAANQVWTEVSSGTGPVINSSLGTLDTTLMLNGIYSLRLKATDEYGQFSFTSISILVDKNFKVGQFQIAFSDLNVPVAGLPIEVVRSYDSRDKRVGDFGVGWQLGLRSARVEKTGILGLGWTQTVTSGFVPTYCLEPTRPHKVAITFGDGKVFKFRASTAIHCQQAAPISATELTFIAEPGTHATLESTTSTDVLVAVQGSIPGPVQLINHSNPDIYNTGTFRLTTAEGTVYVIDQRTGVSSVRDPYNNTLTIGAGGIVHSSGQSIAFVRDGAGRITQITDPNGNAQTYVYDANGDLISFTDREQQTTTFTYNSNHHLHSITDARGVELLTNQYDAGGRMIGQTDAFNKSLVYDHDVSGRIETITDRLGYATRYEYDERGNVLRQVDAKGGIKTFTYDSFDNVLTETNPLGKTTTYTYDAADNRTSIKDPLDNITSFTYNGARQPLTVTDARNNVTTNTYDAAGTNLLTTTDPLAKTTTFTYNVFTGQRSTMKDALDHLTQYGYDSAGRVNSETDALGHVTTFGYDSNGNRTTQTVTRTNAGGQTETITTTYTYDKLNRLTKTTFADGSFTRVEYNAIGQQVATIDQLGRRTEFTYDDMGRMTGTDYPDGTHEETIYDAEGRRLTSKDRAGRNTSFTYDELGRLTKTTYPDNTFTSTAYNAAGQALTTTDARGNLTRYFYDDAGRRTKVRNALNQETTFTYDANGNQLSMTDALSHTTSFEYDLNNRRTKTTYADSSFDTVGYDALGRSVFKTDQAGKTTQFTYDVLGRLTKVWDALNQETTYTYNEVSQQLTQTDANNHTTRFEYDQLGRRTKRILPAGQFETYAYDTGGNLQTRTDFNSKTTTYNHDLMRRVLSKIPDASLNQPTISFTYNTNGQRATMSDASGLTTYTYDGRNRLSSKQTPFGTLSYTYDDGGNLLTTRSSNANGTNVDYSYDALNRLATVKDNNLATLNGGITTYNYDTVGNLQSYLYPNGVTTTYSYNTLNRLTSINAIGSVSTLSSYAYTLGASGNRTAVTELGGRTVSYTYDDLYRLTNETIANDTHGINGTVSYGYDPVGNRLNRNSSLAGVPSQSSTFDANDRLTSDSYDANGNTKVSSSGSYDYDFENRLITHTSSVTSGFVYDGDGNRVAKTVGGVTINYLVDTNNHTGYAQVVEDLQSGAVVKQFTYGHDLISQRCSPLTANCSLSFYGYDGHGSVRQLTDASAAVTDAYDYDAFGNLIYRSGTTPNDYLYSGEQLDANLGFYYLRSRYLNPLSGRFWTMDIVEGSVHDPSSLHKYLYSNGDPVNRVDPSGRMSTELLVGIAVASIIASIVIIGVVYALTRPMPTRFVSFEWRNTWTLRDENLTYEEIQETKNLALENFRKAFLGFGVVVTNGQAGNRIIVEGFSNQNAVGLTEGLANESYVYYHDIRILAERIGKNFGITDRNEVLRGIGRAIGRVAAHEFGHQGFPSFTIHNTDDPESYDYWDGGSTWALYYGELHWSERSLQGMRRDLAH